jgi:FG-GAP repeat
VTDSGEGVSLTHIAYLKADQPEDTAWFGYAVAVDEIRQGVLTIAPREDLRTDAGTLTDAGAAYLFEPTNGEWRSTKLIAPNVHAHDGVLPADHLPSDLQFVGSDFSAMRVDLDQDLAVVGVVSEASANAGDMTDTSAPFSGAVYVYDRNALTTLPQYLKAPSPEPGALFGTGLSLSSPFLAVGAPIAHGSGTVYVYESTNGRFSDQPVEVPYPKAQAGGAFGTSVSLRGTFLVVGAPGEDGGIPNPSTNTVDNPLKNSGAAYVFEHVGTDWKSRNRIEALGPAMSSFFGFSVTAERNSTVAVGAPTSPWCSASETRFPFRGAVYVANRSSSSGGWSVDHCRESDSGALAVTFGWATRLAEGPAHGDRMLAAAPFDSRGSAAADPSDVSQGSSGAAYLYGRSGPTDDWKKLAYIKAPIPQAGSVFGNDLAMTTGLIAVGAPRESGGQTGPNADLTDTSVHEAGAVFLYSLSP